MSSCLQSGSCVSPCPEAGRWRAQRQHAGSGRNEPRFAHLDGLNVLNGIAREFAEADAMAKAAKKTNGCGWEKKRLKRQLQAATNVKWRNFCSSQRLLMIFETKTENRSSANQPWWGFAGGDAILIGPCDSRQHHVETEKFHP